MNISVLTLVVHDSFHLVHLQLPLLYPRHRSRSSSTARVACVTRPAALRRGAKVKPICPDVIVRSWSPATSISF